jgi:hypothetical protein
LKFTLTTTAIYLAELRAQLQTAIGLNAAPQLLVRFGYAAAMPRSLRRPAADILISL